MPSGATAWPRRPAAGGRRCHRPATHSQNLKFGSKNRVPPQSPCAGIVLRDSGLRERFGVIVVAIKRAADTMIFNPAPEERIEAGDRLVVLARPHASKRSKSTLAARRDQRGDEEGAASLGPVPSQPGGPQEHAVHAPAGTTVWIPDQW